MRMFVYGSLKRGFHNHGLLRGSRFFGDGTTQPSYDMLDFGPFPGVIPDGSFSIRGEIFVVSDEVRDEVDLLEGHPVIYRRIKIPVRTQQGVVPAWMYLYESDRDDSSPVPPQGRYKTWFRPWV